MEKPSQYRTISKKIPQAGFMTIAARSKTKLISPKDLLMHTNAKNSRSA
jgi:hypothetical protein